MSVGRRNNADPRWLLPIICRLGHVTKKEIGSIKIFDRETKFEIVKSHASKFASAARKTNDEDIRIEPAEAGPGKPRDAKPWSGPKGKGGPKRDASSPGPEGREGRQAVQGPQGAEGQEASSEQTSVMRAKGRDISRPFLRHELTGPVPHLPTLEDGPYRVDAIGNGQAPARTEERRRSLHHCAATKILCIAT